MDRIESKGNNFEFVGQGCASDVFGRLVCNGEFVTNLNKCNSEFCTYCNLQGCSLVSNRLDPSPQTFGLLMFFVVLLGFITYKIFN